MQREENGESGKKNSNKMRDEKLNRRSGVKWRKTDGEKIRMKNRIRVGENQINEELGPLKEREDR